MLSSFRIARVAGIDVKVHSTFLLLLIWIAFSSYSSGHSLSAAMASAGFIVLLFGIVVLHELGHALAAARYGIKTKQIMLLPIGGVASLDRIPEDPKQEFVVAVAGPMVNVIIAALCFAFLGVFGRPGQLFSTNVSGFSLVSRLFWTNVILVVFNMLPAFPMDGGRVLRSLLSMVIGRPRATAIAAGIGQAVAVLFGLLGLFFNPILILTAIFVWVGARTEANQVQLESAMKGYTASDVMIRHFETMTPEMDLEEAERMAESGFQRQFPVVFSGDIIGSVAQQAIIDALVTGYGRQVRDVMRHQVLAVAPDESLNDLLHRWQEAGVDLAVVVGQGAIVGLITPEQIAQHLAASQYRRRTQGGSQFVRGPRP